MNIAKNLLIEQRKALANAIKIDGILKSGGRLNPKELGSTDTQTNVLYLLLVYNLQTVLKNAGVKAVDTDAMADVLCQAATIAIANRTIWTKEVLFELLETVLKG